MNYNISRKWDIIIRDKEEMNYQIMKKKHGGNLNTYFQIKKKKQFQRLFSLTPPVGYFVKGKTVTTVKMLCGRRGLERKERGVVKQRF
jgi:hypothetical protein